MKKRPNRLLFFMILGIFLALALIFRGFLLDYFVKPIALICWAAYRLIASVDQKIYWLLLIFCSFFLILRILPPRAEETQEDSGTGPSKAAHGVKYWQSLLQDAAHGERQDQHLRQRVKNLLVAGMAVEEKIGDLEALKRLEAHQADLPAPVDAFLLPAADQKVSIFHLLKTKISRHLPVWLTAQLWGYQEQQRTFQSIDQTFQWIESTLEIHHDN